jgi:protein-S-isoprenylcysteine O-methyltransferase Ste14
MSNIKFEKRPKAADIVGGVLAVGVIGGQAFVDVAAPQWLTVVAVALLLLAIVFIGLPFRDLPRYGLPRPGEPSFATTRLVDKGVYRLVRHPQYLGYTLLVLGFGALNPHPAILGLAGGAAAFFYLQAVQEERACRAEWPSPYEAYMGRVPRFNFLLGVIRVVRERLTRARG